MKLHLEYDFSTYLNLVDDPNDPYFEMIEVEVNDYQYEFITDTLRCFEIVQRILEEKISEQKILKKHVQENQSE